MLTAEEFLAQRHTYPQKVELVGGIVYPMYDGAQAMTGGTDQHNKVTVNAVLALGPVARHWDASCSRTTWVSWSTGRRCSTRT